MGKNIINPKDLDKYNKQDISLGYAGYYVKNPEEIKLICAFLLNHKNRTTGESYLRKKGNKMVCTNCGATFNNPMTEDDAKRKLQRFKEFLAMLEEKYPEEKLNIENPLEESLKGED